SRARARSLRHNSIWSGWSPVGESSASAAPHRKTSAQKHEGNPRYEEGEARKSHFRAEKTGSGPRPGGRNRTGNNGASNAGAVLAPRLFSQSPDRQVSWKN